MAIFFTSDTHFGHNAINRLSKRGFHSLQEMDEALVERWNARVGPDDRVYHLGDFCFKGSKKAQFYLEKLQGEIVFIRGNHDTENTMSLERWRSSHDMLEIKLEGRQIFLCHYPMLEWPGAFRGAFHFHGHTHGKVPPNEKRCDVGVDVWDYQPVTLAEILERLAKAPGYDPEDAYGPA